jgi:hypothetical protein
MITFRRIRRRDIFHYFVIILHVSELHMREYAKNAHNIVCPDLGKTFKFKIRNVNFGTVA